MKPRTLLSQRIEGIGTKVALGSLVLLAACAPMSESTSYQDTLLSSQLRDQMIAEAATYTAVPEVRSDSLVIAISQADRCATIETKHLHRITHTERHTNTQAMTGFSVVGALFGFAGVYAYTHADSIAATQTQAGNMETPGQVRSGSIAAITMGGLALSALVGSLVRARDTDHDNGVVTESEARKQYACNARPVRATSVTLDLGNATVRSTTDDDGRAVFALLEVPSAAIPQPGQQFSVVVGAVRATVQLADNEVAVLWRGLSSNPASRWAQDCNYLLHQIGATLLTTVDLAAIDKAEQTLRQIAVVCTSPHHIDREHALSDSIAKLRAAIALEEEREVRRSQQQQGRAYDAGQLRSDKLRQWTCSGGDSRKIAYGVLACLAPQAGPLCADIAKRGLKAATLGLLARANLSVVERAIVVPVANALVIGLSADVAQRAEELCSRWVDGMHLQAPQQLTWNNCLFTIHDWTAQMCSP